MNNEKEGKKGRRERKGREKRRRGDNDSKPIKTI